MSPETILMMLKLLDLLASVTIRSVTVKSEFSALREEIGTMVAEGRDPTPEEQSDMDRRVDEMHARLQGDGGPDPD